jgi:TPR repeat protein
MSGSRASVSILVLVLALTVSACGSSGGKTARDEAGRDVASLAAQGDASAQYAMGQASKSSNAATATQWFCKAARQGEARAQFELAMIYGNDLLETGLGARIMRIGGGSGEVSSSNARLAAMWLDLAMANGHKEAAKRRIALGKRMSAADHIAVEKLRAKWQEVPCEPGQGSSGTAATVR